MTGHTVGPWEVFDKHGTLAVFSPRHTKRTGRIYEIIHWAGFDSSDVASLSKRKANAALIAAAPELLDALREMVCCREVNAYEQVWRRTLIQARAAIAKATQTEGE